MDAELYLLSFIKGPFGLSFAAIWGALWGSFFNVVICRLPSGESLISPPSHCRVCKERVRWYDNIPIISYLWLRGKCRFCSATYSSRYFWVEIVVMILAVGMYYHFIQNGSGDIRLMLARFFITSTFCGLLVAISFIDIDTFLIPNTITYPGIPIAVMLSVFMGHPHLWDGLAGAFLGYGIIRLIADVYQLVTKRQGMGYGDAKLLAMTGGLLGWQSIYPTLLLGAFQGSLIGITLLVIMRKKNREYAQTEYAKRRKRIIKRKLVEKRRLRLRHSRPIKRRRRFYRKIKDYHVPLRHAQLPFGPYLCLGAVEAIFLGPYLPQLFPFFY